MACSGLNNSLLYKWMKDVWRENHKKRDMITLNHGEVKFMRCDGHFLGYNWIIDWWVTEDSKDQWKKNKWTNNKWKEGSSNERLQPINTFFHLAKNYVNDPCDCSWHVVKANLLAKITQMVPWTVPRSVTTWLSIQLNSVIGIFF